MTYHKELVEGWTRLLRIRRSESTAIMRLADRCVTDYLTSCIYIYTFFQFLLSQTNNIIYAQDMIYIHYSWKMH